MKIFIMVLRRKSIAGTQPMPEIEDLQEVDAMLEENAARWETQYKNQCIAIGRAEGMAEGRAKGLAQGRAEGWKDGRAEGWKDGRAEGWKDGRAEGWKDGMANVARNLLHLGLPIAQIAAATGLSPAEIEALRQVQ